MAKRLSVIDVDRCVGCQACMFACARRVGEGGLEASCIHVHSAGGIRKGFVVVVCRACPDPPCARSCPTDALTPREGGGVKFKPNLCVSCKNCVEACPSARHCGMRPSTSRKSASTAGIARIIDPYDVIAMEEVLGL
jgi:Fe-S-cluster-containing dehydrogenase component